jgi:hypothetical protein
VSRLRLLAVVAALVAGALVSGVGASWASHRFDDVPTAHPFHDEIDWMVANGITEGYQDGTFRPANAVSRQAFAAFLQRYNDSIEVVPGSDVPSSSTPFYVRTISCPPGKRAIAGGGNAIELTNNLLLAGTAPTSNGSGWRVAWTSRTGGNAPVTAFFYWVACMPT